MLQLMFNPGLTFIGFRTTRPWYVLGVKTPFSSADSALDQFFKTISGDLVSCEAQLPAADPERSPRSSGHEWAAELEYSVPPDRENKAVHARFRLKYRPFSHFYFITSSSAKWMAYSRFSSCEAKVHLTMTAEYKD